LMQPILREGTPVSLISVEDLSAKTAGPIDFVLAHDIEVSGAVVATAGSKASGEVSYNGVQIGDGGAMQVGLKGVHLKVGNTEVPLRSSQKRGSDGALEYHRLEDSGRIAIELYVGENVALKAGQ